MEERAARDHHRLHLNGAEFDLTRRIVVGRDTRCDLTLDDASVSRQHAVIDLDGGAVWIEDSGSRNGTFVNGGRVLARTQLHDGDRLRLGSVDGTYVLRCHIRPQMRECGSCGAAFAGERCTSCRALAEDAPAGVLNTPILPHDRQVWWLGLRLEVLERALSSGDPAVIRRAMLELTTGVAAIPDPGLLPPESLDRLFSLALGAARRCTEPTWLASGFDIARRARRLLAVSSVAEIRAMPRYLLAGAAPAFEAYVAELGRLSHAFDSAEALCHEVLVETASLLPQRRATFQPGLGV